jgi:hypothetical protein
MSMIALTVAAASFMPTQTLLGLHSSAALASVPTGDDTLLNGMALAAFLAGGVSMHAAPSYFHSEAIQTAVL